MAGIFRPADLHDARPCPQIRAFEGVFEHASQRVRGLDLAGASAIKPLCALIRLLGPCLRLREMAAVLHDFSMSALRVRPSLDQRVPGLRPERHHRPLPFQQSVKTPFRSDRMIPSASRMASHIGSDRCTHLRFPSMAPINGRRIEGFSPMVAFALLYRSLIERSTSLVRSARQVTSLRTARFASTACYTPPPNFRPA